MLSLSRALRPWESGKPDESLSRVGASGKLEAVQYQVDIAGNIPITCGKESEIVAAHALAFEPLAMTGGTSTSSIESK
jgi:hypothetical protein